MKTHLLGLIATAALMFTNATQAAVINFDDLDAGGKLASIGKYNPYQDIAWSNNWLLGVNTLAGYNNGAHSGSQFVNNFGVNNISFSSATAFDFAGAWFAIPNTNGTRATWVNVSAYDAANQLIGSTGNINLSNTYAFIAANFDNVSKITVTRDKGFFIMDDVTLVDAAEVPEPAGLALAALAITALGVSRRRG